MELNEIKQNKFHWGKKEEKNSNRNKKKMNRNCLFSKLIIIKKNIYKIEFPSK